MHMTLATSCAHLKQARKLQDKGGAGGDAGRVQWEVVEPAEEEESSSSGQVSRGSGSEEIS